MELLEELQVVLEHQADVVDAVLQHGDALDADAEGEAGVLGCYLVMTGRGCDDIFRILDSRNYTFGDMFKHCERRYGLDNFHFTSVIKYPWRGLVFCDFPGYI